MYSSLVIGDVRNKIKLGWAYVIEKIREDMKLNERLRIDILNC